MEVSKIIEYKESQIQKVGSTIAITDKLLALHKPLLIPFRKGDKWGYCTPDKELIIDCIYDIARRFYEGLAHVNLNGEHGYIDMKGKSTNEFEASITLSLDIVSKFEVILTKERFVRDESINSIQKNGKFGFYSKDGNEIISAKFDLAQEFYDGLAKVKLEGRWGYINKNGVEYWEE